MVSFDLVWLIGSLRDKPPEWISAGAALVSVCGLFLVWRQLSLTKKIAQLTFEDALEKEYRDLVKQIPTKALLDSDLSQSEYMDTFDEFFRYFDLSNSQIMLRRQGRIGDATWKNWCSGMRFNFSFPAFVQAWSEVEMRTLEQSDQFFSELRRLVTDDFETDPKRW